MFKLKGRPVLPDPGSLELQISTLIISKCALYFLVATVTKNVHQQKISSTGKCEYKWTCENGVTLRASGWETSIQPAGRRMVKTGLRDRPLSGKDAKTTTRLHIRISDFRSIECQQFPGHRVPLDRPTGSEIAPLFPDPQVILSACDMLFISVSLFAMFAYRPLSKDSS